MTNNFSFKHTEEVTKAESFAPEIKNCEFCRKNPCVCRFLICPFHGKINAKKENDGYNCTKENCKVIRQENELE